MLPIQHQVRRLQCRLETPAACTNESRQARLQVEGQPDPHAVGRTVALAFRTARMQSVMRCSEPNPKSKRASPCQMVRAKDGTFSNCILMLERPKLGSDRAAEIRSMSGAILHTSRQSKYSVGYSLKGQLYTVTRIRPSSGMTLQQAPCDAQPAPEYVQSPALS